MGRRIDFVRPDGTMAPGYLAEPQSADGAPGVVMFEEWWGVNDQIVETADRLANDGFRVLVPDVFRGKVAEDANEANHLMESLDFGDAATEDARGAAAELRKLGSDRVAVMGFCMGGALAFLAAMRDSDFDAALIFYGYPPPEAGDPGQIQIPVMGHWATEDGFFPSQGVDVIESALRRGGVPHEFYRYDAGHAFYNPGGIGNHHPEYAELAWGRSVDFLNRTLRAPGSGAD
jgi:carboxymethylenebutenolidase